MLSRLHTSFALTLFASMSLIAGCIIVDGTDTTTGGSGGGSGGSGGTGGSGGAGGTGGTTSNTGGGGAGGGTGGTGGGPTCVGAMGTGLDVLSCDNMNITPAPKGAASSTCEPDGGTFGKDPPPGYLYCQHGFKIFTAGSAEYLQACYGKISVAPADACDPKQAAACIDEMYKAACSSDDADKLCNETATVCGVDPFDAKGCAYQLKTFNSTALAAYVNCFNTAPAGETCQQAHDGCYDAALLITP